MFCYRYRTSVICCRRRTGLYRAVIEWTESRDWLSACTVLAVCHCVCCCCWAAFVDGSTSLEHTHQPRPNSHWLTLTHWPSSLTHFIMVLCNTMTIKTIVWVILVIRNVWHGTEYALKNSTARRAINRFCSCEVCCR